MFPISKSGLGRFIEIEGDPTSASQSGSCVFSRMPRFIGRDGSALDVLRELRLALVGVGSVGSRIADHAARFGPKQVWIVDPACFKAESLATHSITTADVGEPKATNIARRFKSLSPVTRVAAFAGRFQEVDQLALQDVDAVLLATDNLAVEVAVAEMCTHLGKLLLQGSVYGDGLVAQVRVVTNHDPNGPCLACGYGEQDWDHFYRETSFSCTGDGTAATMSTSSLCSIVADLVSTELLRQMLSLGEPATDSLLEYCGYTQTITRSPLVRNHECPCSHIAWKRAKSLRPVRDCSLNELATAVGLADTAAEPITFDVAGHQFVELGVCCKMQMVRRFSPHDQAGRCEQCLRPLSTVRSLAKPRVTAAALGSLLHEPLSELGAESARWVVVEKAGRAVVLN